MFPRSPPTLGKSLPATPMLAGCAGTGLAVPTASAWPTGAATAARSDPADASATVPAVAAALLVRNWRLSTGNLQVH